MRKQAAKATNVYNETVDDISHANGNEELSAGIDLLHWSNVYISIKDANDAYEKIVYWQKKSIHGTNRRCRKEVYQRNNKNVRFLD